MIAATIFLIIATFLLLLSFYQPFVATVYRVRQNLEKVVNLRHFKKNKFGPWFHKFASVIFIIALVCFYFSLNKG